ncbi:helix-turn-helix domain-containing protein [Puniceibacterium sediminis]|uniref:Transcriptional regulator, AraC family n=1 Tax=Puniceibacterium sediminis TaxID=1608407 RepID=A0A238Y6T7_9RHOB|nr:helix-turn-helix domain-containing protein [Puniceibacterium sediminis]SNR66538.1 transcriptional regulator, AraC family [Puniceibacterium sediminis]
MPISARMHDLKSPPDTEVTQIRSQLTSGGWSFRDKRHRGFILQAGQGRVALAGGDLSFVAPCLVWLPAGAGQRFMLDAGSRGVALGVTEVGIAQAINIGPLTSQIRAVLLEPMIKARIDLKQAKQLSEALEKIAEEIDSEEGGAQEAVQHLLALFFIAIWRMSGPVKRGSQPLPRTIALQFLQAVELHLRDHWTVARYAAEIGVTPDRLNATLRRSTGRPPLALIHARIIHEADALLDDSSLQIAEIADDLGFSDPAYFSRFYKRLTGQSPNHQRRDIQSRKSRPSYAAWP